MNSKLRKTLISGAIAALISSPLWAAGDAAEREIPQVQPGQSQAGPGAETPRGVGPGGTPPMGEGRGVGPGDTPPMGQGRGVGPGDTPPMGAGPDNPLSDNPLYARTPDELKDFEVVGAEGEKVGDVKAVVLGPDRERAHVVVGVGGFLGLGERDIIVSLDELELIDDELRISATKEELEAREEYVEELYVELESDRPISEFSAFELTPGETAPGAVEPRDTNPGAMTPRDTDPGATGTPEEPRAPQ